MNKRNKILDFLRDRNMCERDLYWLRKIWYILLLLILSIYILCNFSEFVLQSLICQFNGNSLLFFLWVVLLLLPLVESIEGYGFKVTTERLSRDLRSLTEDIISNKDVPEVSDLTEKFNDIQKTSDDE